MATAPRRPDDELPRGIDVEAFLAWMKDRPGRFELHGGAVIAMSPERLGHVNVKSAAYMALRSGIRSAGVPCHVVGDGVAVQVSDAKWYQPDALVYCGPAASSDSIKIENPTIIVEVLSPSTGHIDEGAKLVGYFSLPSVQHYLIIDPDGPPLVHHRRQSDGSILAHIIGAGHLRFDPPAIEIEVASLFD